MMLMSVVLPAPFGPRSAKISPRSIVRSIGCSAATPLAYDLVSCSIAMTGGTLAARLGDPLHQRPREVRGARAAAEIASAHPILVERRIDGGAQTLGTLRFTAMIEHQRGRK